MSTLIGSTMHLWETDVGREREREIETNKNEISGRNMYFESYPHIRDVESFVCRI